jgi:hypothetical protein
MTTADPRDRAALSDPRVDAAWRALSDEGPPDSLDAAIMAAARREVGAGPQKITPRKAVADRRRWWPLAAAATIAAIAVGVLQLTTPDQLGAPASDESIVTDVPAPGNRPATEAPTAPPRPEETKPNAGDLLRAVPAPNGTAWLRAPTPAPEPHPPAKRESGAGNAPALAEPFPAAPTQAGGGAPATPAAAGAVAVPAPPPQPATAARKAAAPPSPPAAAGPIAVPAPSPPPAAGVPSQGVQESAAERPTPLAKMPAGRAAGAGAGEVRAKDRAPLPVADWIALIRRLRDEGKSADAAKELAAFRLAHADHEKLLPPDLRGWRPPEK